MKHIETLIGTNKSMKTKPLTFLLALTFLLTLFNNCYAGEITGSSKIVRLSLEKYALPIIQSFNVSKLKRIGFDRADKATANLPPIEGTKNINGYSYLNYKHQEVSPFLRHLETLFYLELLWIYLSVSKG